MAHLPFTKSERDMIEKSIRNITKVNLRSVLNRCKHAGIIKELCYAIGCEYIKLSNLKTHHGMSSFELPPVCRQNQDSNESLNETGALNTNAYINKVLITRRGVEKCIVKVIQNKIDDFLFSTLKFPRYSEERMRLEKNTMIGELRKVEDKKKNDEILMEQIIQDGASFIADLHDIDHIKTLLSCQTSEVIDMDTLEADYQRYNANMMRVVVKVCGKNAAQLLRELYVTSKLDNINDQFINVRNMQSRREVAMFLDMGLLQTHPTNNELVKLANFRED